jgi:hypothetical protein
MLRIGLAVYLMIVHVAGPWFCCCTVRRLGRWLPTIVHAEQERTPVSCCPHCKTQHDQKRTAAEHLERKAPPSQEPPPCHCPCRKHGVNGSRFLPAHSLAFELLRSFTQWEKGREHLLLAGIPLLSGVGPCLAPDRENPLLPFLPTKGILHVLHILRC